MGSVLFFYLGFIFITVHEMDAVRCKEWRIFPGLSRLSDALGAKIFIIAHIPIFLCVLWLYASFPDGLRISMDVFCVSHLLLHIVYAKHKKNEFKGVFSWLIIIGCAIFGFIDLLEGV